MIGQISLHLNSDEKLREILDLVPITEPTTDDDIYFVLMRSIVEQQVSVKAAATIWGRFLDLFDDYPHPDHVLAFSGDELNAAGLSFQKAGYIQNIARFSKEQDLSNSYINSLNDAAAVAHLTQIKGVGKWTAEMILMFSLNRPDVFPVDDLVIRNAMIKLYGVTCEKRQLIRDLEEIAEPWSPYRSYACYSLWSWFDKT
ncbi:MAG: DNA-3-methyladenine glycosylase 2 family protein [Flavobacteriales bacterium]|nr:DNA-3-methyladenine glycosylase 2 family protein [Flavobacteriales bacterium]